MLGRHVSNEKPDHYRLWNLLMLELWYREFLDGRTRSNRRRDGCSEPGSAQSGCTDWALP